MRAALASALWLPLLAGCAATQGSFPSLAPRAVERELAQERPPPAPPAIADDPALSARVAQLAGQARQGQGAFEPAFARARAAAAGAGAAGSESWIAAQLEFTRLEAARAPTLSALAELDALAIARVRQATSSGDMAALTAAVAEVQAIADRQHEQLESLRASLSPA